MRYSAGSLAEDWLTGARKPLAFLAKDFVNAASYKLAFVSQIFGIFFSVITFFFMSRLFGSAVLPYLEPYGGNYFSFVLVGIALASYLQVSLNSFSANIRDAQILGTLEAVLVTQTEIPTIILCASLYSFAMTSVRVLAFLLFGVFVFGMDIGGANLGGAAAILLITIIAFSSLGILSASFVMVWKLGNPLNWIFGNLSWVLGGVLYPVTVLPDWLQQVAYLLPITYALDGMRLALLKGYPLSRLWPSVLPLLAFAGLMLPASVWVFQRAVRKAKRDGTLTHY